MHYLMANDLPTLVWIANLASIELHPSLSLATDIATPTMIVFDLDPGPRQYRAMLPGRPLGPRHLRSLRPAEFRENIGLQRLANLHSSQHQDQLRQTKSFAHAIARLLEQQHPDLVVSDMKKADSHQ